MGNYMDNGVSLSKKIVRQDSEIEIVYEGILAQHGAENITAHLGYNEGWDSVLDIDMEKDQNLFKTKLKVENTGILNIAFKDSADNWDNNSGENYSFKVNEKINKKTETKEKTKTTKKGKKKD